MDQSTTFICNCNSDKPLSEGLSHQMEECNRNGRWSRIAQCLILNFSPKSLLMYVHLFIYLFIILSVLSFCHQAHIAARLEAGSGLTPGLDRTRPADVLVRDWAQGKSAAFDITVTSPLTPAILAGASRRVEAAENRKHKANDPKCAELGWRCVPLAVETYCNWGEEARRTFTLLAIRLALNCSV